MPEEEQSIVLQSVVVRDAWMRWEAERTNVGMRIVGGVRENVLGMGMTR